jgi:multiple sugar transport system ATP-binding protein
VAVVRLDRVSKRYDSGEPAVRDLSLTIGDGEFMVLLGPSGCGKSTTLRMVAGLEALTDGELWIDDRPMRRVPAKDRDIAMVFQSYALYPHMTVFENMAFGLRRRAVPRPEVDRRVRETAATIGLEGLLHRKPYALSGGQRQRVALGRAIVRDPEVFLFDEPLSNLDAALRVSTRNEIARLHRRLGATMIYVTHDQVEAMSMGTRIAIMNRGELVQVGPPMDVYRNPADTFVARFLGSPPMNLAPGGVERDVDGVTVWVGGARIPLGRRAASLPTMLPDAVTVGVRAEDIAEDGPGVPGAPFQGQVTAVEALGAETLVSFRLPQGAEMTARVGRDAASRPDAPGQFRIRPEAIHIFDRGTGRALPFIAMEDTHA